MLVSFLVFRGLLGFASDRLAAWTRVGRKVWIGALVLALLGAAGGTVWGELHRLVPGLSDVTERARGQLQERMQAVRDTDLFRMLEAQQVDPEKCAEKVQGFAEAPQEPGGFSARVAPSSPA